MHIIKIAENKLGEDHIMGDLHGELKTFNMLLDKLNDHDRLFMVGDLGDRGKKSAGVYDKIIAINAACTAAGLPPKIYSIRGNHEDSLLRYINSKLFPEGYTDEVKMKITNQLLKMGGEWALSLTEDQLKRYKTYIDCLPYIMYVEGERPFILAHADLPFSDNELARRIAENLPLNDYELRYCTTARDRGPGIQIATLRNAYSTPVYCGHTFLGGFRRATNHFNLDIGTASTFVICDVNHTAQCCRAVSSTGNIPTDISNIINTIDMQLKLLKAQDEIAKKNKQNSHVDFRELCGQILEIMGEFQCKYTSFYADAKPAHVKIYNALFTTIDTITTDLNNSNIDAADAFEEMVDLIENVVVLDAQDTFPQQKHGLFSSPEIPQAYVTMLNAKPDLKHDTRMLGIILAKIYEKYYNQPGAILHDDVERKLWAGYVNNITDLYSFKTEFPNVAKNISSSPAP
jgi:hypothetical protein